MRRTKTTLQKHHFRRIPYLPDTKPEQKQQPTQDHHSLNNSVAVLVAYHLAIQQPFMGGPCVTNYPGDLIGGIFPERRESFPILTNTLGILSSLFAICIINKVGRRKIILYSTLAEGVCLCTAAALCFVFIDYLHPDKAPYSIRLTVTYLMIFMRIILAATFSPVCDIYITEIIQGDPTVYFTFFQWASMALVMSIFPILCGLTEGGNPYYGFALFGGVTILSFLLNARYVIETKSKSEIEVRRLYDEKFPDKKDTKESKKQIAAKK